MDMRAQRASSDRYGGPPSSSSFFSTLRQSVGNESEELSDLSQLPSPLRPKETPSSDLSLPEDGRNSSTRAESVVTLKHHNQPLTSTVSQPSSLSPPSSVTLPSFNFSSSKSRPNHDHTFSSFTLHGSVQRKKAAGATFSHDDDHDLDSDCESPRSKSHKFDVGNYEFDDKKRLVASMDSAAMAAINSYEEGGHRASLLGRWCPPLRAAGRFLRWCNPGIKDTTLPGSSLIGSWYLSPEQHVLEFFLVNLAFIGLLVYFGISLAQHAPVEAPAKPSGTVIMYIIAGMLVMSFLYAIYYKWCTRTMIFLLQPCHVVTTLELLVLFCPRGSYLDMTPLFNVLLFCIWNPLIAVLQPDLRDYKHWIDIFNFFFQHALIILIPFYLLLTRQFDFYGWSLNGLVVSFTLQVLFHYIVLELFSIAAGVNLNYMMAPPPGPLQWFKSWYRWIMLGFSFGLTVGQRLLFVDGLWWLLGDTLYTNVFSHLP